MTEEKYNTKDIRHIDEKSQEFIAKGNRMTVEIINSDGSRNWQANILLDNIKRLEQENRELGRKAFLAEQNVRTTASTFCEKDNKIIELEQENKELKKQLLEDKILDEHIESLSQEDIYRTALEKIREIIRADCKDCTAECDCDDSCTRYKIQNKINECIGE